MSAKASADLVVHATRFCRLLREHGLLATQGDTLDVVRVLGLVDITDRVDFHAALRSVLVHRLEDIRPFEECFDAFWGAAHRASAARRRTPAPNQKTEAGPLSLDAWAHGEGEQE